MFEIAIFHWSCQYTWYFCHFWATVCKTVRPMLSVRCLSVLSVCNVCTLWPNGWTDQDETWHAGRPRPWPLCITWGPSSPSPKGGQSPQFSAHICCSQMAGWIKMPLGMEVSLSPGDFVLDGNPAPLNFWPMFIIVIVISLEHCTKHSRYWFIQVQVLYSMHSIFRKV